jgi:hypothetical protein
MPDSAEKRSQISKLYASMADEELKKLADEAWSLTDVGRDLLKAELTGRKLDFELATTIAPESLPKNIALIRQFRDLPEALLAKGFLESAGIEGFLADETTIRMDWLWSNGLGGIKLCVSAEDEDAATQLLNQEIPENFQVDGIGDYEQPRCPQCQSLNISIEDLDKPVAHIGILFLNLPIAVSCREWKCNSCGTVWPPSTTD